MRRRGSPRVILLGDDRRTSVLGGKGCRLPEASYLRDNVGIRQDEQA